MVLPNEATKIIIEEFPELKNTDGWNYYKENTHWHDYMLKMSTEDALNFTKLMSIVTNYVADILREKQEALENKKLQKIFALTESFLKQGNKDVQDVMTTNFLENLINISSHGDFEPSTFIHYLGPKSKAYCKAWDEFTGVKTPGLWEE